MHNGGSSRNGKGHEIDNSGPLDKPVFFASLKSSSTYHANQVYKFDDVKTNIGNHYNPSTGEFTAPRNGIYQIYCVIMSSGHNRVHYQLNKNDVAFAPGYTSKVDSSSGGFSTNIWILELKKDDRVYIQHIIDSQVINRNYSYFGGYLL